MPKLLQENSNANDLKARLDWGEPALTILDVRERAAYADCHITGALSMPIDQLVSFASESLERERDIYVYGNCLEQATDAVKMLKNSGFKQVASLKDGLSGWKAINGPVE